jgi:hypothetical protein
MFDGGFIMLKSNVSKAGAPSYFYLGLATLGLAAGLVCAPAHATVAPAPQQNAGACKQLSGITDRTICMSEAANVPVAPMPINRAATAADQQKMAACTSQFITLRGVCAEEAGYGEPVPKDTLSPAQHRALGQENSAYLAKVAACKELIGIDEKTICLSEAGNSSALAGALG